MGTTTGIQWADRCPNLRFLLLTKRPQNVRRMWPSADVFDSGGEHKAYWPNVHLLTSISDQRTADVMVPELSDCRDLVPVLGVSAEPLLGPWDATAAVGDRECFNCGLRFIDGIEGPRPCARCYAECEGDIYPVRPSLDWVIIGVESNGPRVGRLSIDGKATEADWLGWATSIVEQCRAAGVAVFVKQIPLDCRLVHDVEQFPAALRFQEFPQAQ